MRVLNILFLLAYLASAGVQFNDPDPFRSIVIYAGAALLCVLWEFRTGPRSLPGIWGALALGYAMWLAFQLPPGLEIAESLTQWEMKAEGAEELREIGGLLLVTLWMFPLGLRPRGEPEA